MRQATAAACSVVGVAALAPASSIDAHRRRLFEKVKIAVVGALHFLPLSIARDPPRKSLLNGGIGPASNRSLASKPGESRGKKVSTTGEKTSARRMLR